MVANLELQSPIVPPDSQSAAQPSSETIDALMGAARAGDHAALQKLSGLRSNPPEAGKVCYGAFHAIKLFITFFSNQLNSHTLWFLPLLPPLLPSRWPIPHSPPP